MRVHLDTDFAGETDDAAALAMLLGWPDVEILGITTTADPDGRRAAYVRRFLELAGRAEIPVVAGAGSSLSGAAMGGLPDHAAYWGGAVVSPEPVVAGAAVDLLAASFGAGAVVVGIGPFTNLARVERAHPGMLGDARVVLMGGWLAPPAPGLPPWGADMDWNVQCDPDAARSVFAAAAKLTLVTLPATMTADLRSVHVSRLEASGPIGALLARQALAHGAEHGTFALARKHAALPDDLLNFQWDPVACAVALGWSGATVETMRLRTVDQSDGLRFEPADDGRLVDVVVAVDGDAFSDRWLSAIERADRGASHCFVLGDDDFRQ